jgi:hypothetical protein
MAAGRILTEQTCNGNHKYSRIPHVMTEGRVVYKCTTCGETKELSTFSWTEERVYTEWRKYNNKKRS